MFKFTGIPINFQFDLMMMEIDEKKICQQLTISKQEKYFKLS